MTTPPPSPFVGRHVELAQVHRAFERCRTVGATLVAIEAPAGHGKSALLRRVSETLGDSATVIRVAPSEFEQSVPYGLLQQLRSALSSRTPWIPVGDEFRAHDPWDAGSQLLELANEYIGEPVVLLIDDLHWADEDSLTALTFAFRRLGAAPLLAVVAFRSGVGDTDTVRRLSIDEDELVTLAGFTSDEVAELADRLDRELDRPAAARLASHTGGSPLHVRALFEELSTAELNAEVLPAPRGTPRSVWAQLERCSAPARDLLAAAAVLGPPCRCRRCRGRERGRGPRAGARRGGGHRPRPLPATPHRLGAGLRASARAIGGDRPDPAGSRHQPPPTRRRPSRGRRRPRSCGGGRRRTRR